MSEILVLVEHADGRLKKLTVELLAAASALGSPSAVVVGAAGTAAALTEQLAAAGAAKIYAAESVDPLQVLLTHRSPRWPQLSRPPAIRAQCW